MCIVQHYIVYYTSAISTVVSVPPSTLTGGSWWAESDFDMAIYNINTTHKYIHMYTNIYSGVINHGIPYWRVQITPYLLLDLLELLGEVVEVCLVLRVQNLQLVMLRIAIAGQTIHIQTIPHTTHTYIVTTYK